MTPQRIGAGLRTARMSAGWSLHELERRSGCSRNQLSRIERGAAAEISLRMLEVLAIVGMELSCRPFPQGPPLRDVAHARLLSRFRARLSPRIRLRTEGPLRNDEERRAWDGELIAGLEVCKLEAETALHDLRAVDRRIARKMLADGVDRAVLLVADGRRNRRVLREFLPLIRERYPSATREVRAHLSTGRLPSSSGCAVL